MKWAQWDDSLNILCHCPALGLGFPCGSAGKESACHVGDLGSIPGLGRSPGEGKGSSLQYSGLREFHALYSPWGCKELDTTGRLSLWLWISRPDSRCHLPVGLVLLEALNAWSWIGQGEREGFFYSGQNSRFPLKVSDLVTLVILIWTNIWKGLNRFSSNVFDSFTRITHIESSFNICLLN